MTAPASSPVLTGVRPTHATSGFIVRYFIPTIPMFAAGGALALSRLWPGIRTA